MIVRDVDVAIVGGGVAALWLAALAARTKLRVALLTAGLLGSHSSTRNQGWIHSGSFYAANEAWTLAEHCVRGGADIDQLARSTPELIAGPRGECVLRDAEHLDLVTARLRRVGISHQLASAPAVNASRLFRRGDAFPVLHTPDRAVDNSLLLDRLAFQARQAGAVVVANSGQPELRRDGRQWCLREGDCEVRADQVVLALGTGLPTYLKRWRPGTRHLLYASTTTRVVVVPGLGLDAPVLPLFDAAPTVVPVWHAGRVGGVTICVPFDNVRHSGSPRPVTVELAQEVVDLCVRQLPGLADHLRENEESPIGIYNCEKLIIDGQQDGAEESRSFRVDRVEAGLYAFYAGKFTTASVGASAMLDTLGTSTTSSGGRVRRPGELIGNLTVSRRAAARPMNFVIGSEKSEFLVSPQRGYLR
ncbi:NAD(P)/FAD-dependent oxidoreductase [Amycolatopsis panacis]|uniref:NAD(P)/FAD-dependent oxidoreductase n=1 Tax=Amycolatopsis panacis TaxID=2340917 RepID=UPI0013149835|nr:FAD-dependent oxidoreductase [Amycolatopsis panacis]